MPIVVPLKDSTTKKWALWGPFAVAVILAGKLIPNVSTEAVKIIDWAAFAIGAATTGGIGWGLRNAISRLLGGK